MIVQCPSCHQKNRIPSARLHDTAKCGKCKQALQPSAAPINVDGEQFDDIVRNAQVPVLIDFWAEWCGPCKQAAPIVAQTAQKMAGKALVLKVNSDHHPQLSARFGIRGIPNFLVFKGGQKVRQQAGLVDGRTMERWLS